MVLLLESGHMDLASLLAGCDVLELHGEPRIAVSSLVFRAQDARAGSLFFCLRGQRHDGHQFAAEAVAGGASALVCERRLDVPVPQVVVASARRAMALMAARFYGDPSAELAVVGITGTNGKTTSAHLVARCFEAAGQPCGLLGTVVNRIGGQDATVTLTTAESVELQAMFRRMVAAGDRACVMEVSSHALAQDRVAGVSFAGVVFTNLTRDHLDYHGGLEEYFAAKRRLFLPEEERRPGVPAAVNIGDEWGRRLASECAPLYGDDLWTYAVEGEADVSAGDLRLRADGSDFRLAIRRLDLQLDLRTQLGGRFNVENVTAAAAITLALGLPPVAVQAALEGTSGVPGRFEAVRAGQPFAVLVDYSHTPDSLENALRAARAICRGRLIVVFGCGGDRDRGKRPIMGRLASELADLAIVTSDNPRSERPQAIIEEILAGVPEGRRRAVVVESDRRKAIAQALAEAAPGDVVVVAGKGHESGQVFADRRVPFSDREVALELLRGEGS